MTFFFIIKSSLQHCAPHIGPMPGAFANFSDVPRTSACATAVDWAVEKEITNGTGDGLFSPEETCTRGQIAAFLYRDLG